MKKLYEKNQVLFAVLWIIVYCAFTIPFRGSEQRNSSPWMLLALIILTVGAAAFICANGLQKRYGFTGWRRYARRCLYYVPMLVLATGNLWGGVGLQYQGLAQVCAVLSMLLIGFVEEVLFRGFLFRALLEKRGEKPAIIVSAVTFGIGHIVNLLAGQANMETICQVFFAIAWGFIFTYAFYKGGSLWPCILVHSLVDAASMFSSADPVSQAVRVSDWVYMGATILVGIAYCLYLRKQKTAENFAEA